MHTLAARWLEDLFSSRAVESVFWFWREIVLGVTYVLTVQYSCGVVSVFWFWLDIVFGVTYVLTIEYNTDVQLCQFLLWQEIVLKMRTLTINTL
jgi:hypothetical protein